MGAQAKFWGGIYESVCRAYPGLLRNAGRYGRGNTARETTQEMEAIVENRIDREGQSRMEGFMAGYPLERGQECVMAYPSYSAIPVKGESRPPSSFPEKGIK